jgi:hypothetical protein
MLPSVKRAKCDSESVTSTVRCSETQGEGEEKRPALIDSEHGKKEGDLDAKKSARGADFS